LPLLFFVQFIMVGVTALIGSSVHKFYVITMQKFL